MIITFWKNTCFYCQILCLLLFVFCYKAQCDSSCDTRIDNTTLVNLVSESWQSSTWANINDEYCFNTRLSNNNRDNYVITNSINDDQSYQWFMFEFKQHIQLDAVEVVPYFYNRKNTNEIEIWVAPEKMTVDNPSEHCNATFMSRFNKDSWTHCGNTSVNKFLGLTLNCSKTATFTKLLLLRKFTNNYIAFNNIKLHGKTICQKARNMLTVRNNPTVEGKSVTVTLSFEDGSPRPEHNCTLRGTDGVEILKNSSSSDKGSTNYIFTAHRKYSEIICHIRQGNYSQFTETLNELLHIYYPPDTNINISSTEWTENKPVSVWVISTGDKYPILEHKCNVTLNRDDIEMTRETSEIKNKTIISRFTFTPLREWIGCNVRCLVLIKNNFHTFFNETKTLKYSITVFWKSTNEMIINRPFAMEKQTLYFSVKITGGYPTPQVSCTINSDPINYYSYDKTHYFSLTSSLAYDKSNITCHVTQRRKQEFSEFLNHTIRVFKIPQISMIFTDSVIMAGSRISYQLHSSDTELELKYQCYLYGNNRFFFNLNSKHQVLTKPTFQINSDVTYPANVRNCYISCYILGEYQRFTLFHHYFDSKKINVYTQSVNKFNVSNTELKQGSTLTVELRSKGGFPEVQHNCFFDDSMLIKIPKSLTYDEMISEFKVEMKKMHNLKELHCVFNQTYTDFLQENRTIIHVTYAPDTLVIVNESRIWVNESSVSFQLVASDANPMPTNISCQIQCDNEVYHLDNSQRFQTLTNNNDTIKNYSFVPEQKWKNCKINCSVWNVESGQFVYNKSVISAEAKTVYYPTTSTFTTFGNYEQEKFSWIEDKTAEVTLISQGGFPEPAHICSVNSKHWKQTANNSKSDQQNMNSSWIVSKITRSNNGAILSCSLTQGNYTKFNSHFNHTLTVYYPSNLGNISDLVIDKRKVSFNVNTSAGNPPPEVTCYFNAGYSNFVSRKVELVFHFNLDFNNQELVQFMSGNVTCKLTQKPVFEDQIWVNIITVDHVDQRKGNSLTFTLLGSIGSSILVLLVICVLIFVVIRMRNKNKSSISTQQGTISTKLNRQSRRLPPQPSDSSMQLNSLEKNKEVEEEESDEEEVEDDNDEDVEPIPENNDSESEDDSYWKKYGNLTTSEWLKVPSPHYYAELPPVPDWTGFKFKEEPIYDDMIGMEVQGKVQLFEEDVYET